MTLGRKKKKLYKSYLHIDLMLNIRNVSLTQHKEAEMLYAWLEISYNL